MSVMSVQARGFKVDLREPVAVAAPAEVSKVLDAIKSGAQAVVEFCGRHKVILRAAGLAVALTIGFGMEEVFAAPDGVIGEAARAGGAAGFDGQMKILYKRLLTFGKWAIIFKGGFETVSKTMEGDFLAARKAGLAYLLVFVILMGLPWLFDQVEGFFDGAVTTAAPAPVEGGAY